MIKWGVCKPRKICYWDFRIRQKWKTWQLILFLELCTELFPEEVKS